MKPNCLYYHHSHVKPSPYPNPFSVTLMHYASVQLTKENVDTLYRENKATIKPMCHLLEEGYPVTEEKLGFVHIADTLMVTPSHELTSGDVVYAIDHTRHIFSPYEFNIHIIPFSLSPILFTYHRRQLQVGMAPLQRMYQDMNLHSKSLFLSYIAMVSLIFYTYQEGKSNEDSNYYVSGDEVIALSHLFGYLDQPSPQGEVVGHEEDESSSSSSSSSSNSSLASSTTSLSSE